MGFGDTKPVITREDLEKVGSWFGGLHKSRDEEAAKAALPKTTVDNPNVNVQRQTQGLVDTAEKAPTINSTMADNFVVGGKGYGQPQTEDELGKSYGEDKWETPTPTGGLGPEPEPTPPPIKGYNIPGTNKTLYTNKGVPDDNYWKEWNKNPSGGGSVTVSGNDEVNNQTTGNQTPNPTSGWATPGHMPSGVDRSAEMYLVNTPPEKQYQDYLAQRQSGKSGATGAPVSYNDFQKDLFRRMDSFSTQAKGSGLPWDNEAAKAADDRTREMILNNYQQHITTMQDRGKTLHEEISRGLYTGTRLKDALSELSEINSQMPVLFAGMATAHKGIMDVDIDRVSKGEVPTKDLQYKLGLLPLEIEGKKSEIKLRNAQAGNEDEAKLLYKANRKKVEKITAGLPNAEEKQKQRLTEIEYRQKLKTIGDIEKSDQTSEMKANGVANTLGAGYSAAQNSEGKWVVIYNGREVKSY
jgi:hypothetical protein